MSDPLTNIYNKDLSYHHPVPVTTAPAIDLSKNDNNLLPKKTEPVVNTMTTSINIIPSLPVVKPSLPVVKPSLPDVPSVPPTYDLPVPKPRTVLLNGSKIHTGFSQSKPNNDKKKWKITLIISSILLIIFIMLTLWVYKTRVK